jgi:hypothetical protein
MKGKGIGYPNIRFNCSKRNGFQIFISRRMNLCQWKLTTLAGEMEPFIDTYETTCTLLKGTGHIGSEQMMNGGFADTLAENYQNELQRIKENYSGKEYDRQLAILDKAYEEAAQSVSRGYVKQLKMLTGDIVIKPQTGISYSSEAEAENAYQANLEKAGKRKSVIDSGLSNTIFDDVKNILFQLKKCDFEPTGSEK